MLFSEISHLIFDIIKSYYYEVSGRQINSGLVLSYQTSGDFARWNPHWHGLLLEGGFDEEGDQQDVGSVDFAMDGKKSTNFVYLPISNTGKMTELFRRLVIKHFVDKKLINRDFANNLLSWKNPGFSIDNSVKIFGNNNKAKEALAQYIARCPISLEKIKYESFHGKVLFKTPKYSDYFKENFKVFSVLDFIALVTAHIPPKNKQYIRRYGLYASRTRGIWKRSFFIVKLAPCVWKEKNNKNNDNDESIPETQECSTSKKQQNSTWARLIKKVYGVYLTHMDVLMSAGTGMCKSQPLICPLCDSPMEIIAIIMNPVEIEKILKHLVKTGRPISIILP